MRYGIDFKLHLATFVVFVTFSLVTSFGRSVQFGNGIPYSLAVVHSSSHSTVLTLSHSSLEAEYELPVLQSQRGKEF